VWGETEGAWGEGAAPEPSKQKKKVRGGVNAQKPALGRRLSEKERGYGSNGFMALTSNPDYSRSRDTQKSIP